MFLGLRLSSQRSYTGQRRCLLPRRDTKGWSKLASVTFSTIWRPDLVVNLINDLIRLNTHKTCSNTAHVSVLKITLGPFQSSDVGGNTSAAEDLPEQIDAGDFL